MHTRLIQLKHGPAILVRPLRGGDVATVLAVFEQLGEESRRARFNGPKPCLSPAELEQMALVDGSHYALVAYLEGDQRPVAIARLVRTDRRTAEIAFAVADSQQHHGIGSALAAELVADARAAGISEITALAGSDNRAALALVRRVADVREVGYDGPELSIRAAIA
jgi:ribosomal protein S18 acetylase RimI-like enzyme